MKSKKWKYSYFLALFLLLLISAVFFYVWPKWTVDDAFIYFRYAENFVKFGEINWNIGENPVEGYTGVLWLLLISLGIHIGIDPVVFSRALGIIFYFSTFFLLPLIARRLRFSEAITLLLLAFYVFLPYFYTHSLSGLETMMFIFFVLLSYYFYTGVVVYEQRKDEIFLFISLLLLSLTRPEGIAFSIILILGYVYVKGFKKTNSYKLPFLLYLLPYGTYFAVRAIYYGRLFPNTFYAKLNQPFDFFSQILNLAYASAKLYLFFVAGLIVLIIPLIKSLLNQTRDVFSKRLQLFAIPLIATLPVYIVYLNTYLVMNFSYRFWLHFGLLHVVLLSCLFDESIKVSLKEKENNLNLNKRSFQFLILIMLFVSIFYGKFLFNDFREEIFSCSLYRDLLLSEHIKIGKDLHKILPQDAWIACIRDAGAVPYYSKCKAIDFGVLNDEFLTSIELGGKSEINYLFSKMPDVIVITSVERARLSHPIPWINNFLCLLRTDKRFIENYYFYRAYEPEGAAKNMKYFEFVFIRKDVKIKDS